MSKCAKFSEGLKEGLSRISSIVLQNHESSTPHLEVGNQRLIRVVELPAPRKAADKRNLEGLQLFHKDFGAEAGIKEPFSDLEPLLMEAQDSRTSDIYPDIWGPNGKHI